MTNTDIIHNTAIVYAQKKGMRGEITEELLQSMYQDLMLLAPEYGIELRMRRIYYMMFS